MDASKQSKRIRAYVAGFLGTERITLDDNLLARASLPEIEAVMAHEMGHYVLNHVSIVRSAEYEADLFGLNAARQPDGFAQVALKLSEYRKLEPGKLEEIIFYDHPSGRTRIFTAMRWKAEHAETWTPAPREPQGAAGAGASRP